MLVEGFGKVFGTKTFPKPSTSMLSVLSLVVALESGGLL